MDRDIVSFGTKYPTSKLMMFLEFVLYLSVQKCLLKSKGYKFLIVEFIPVSNVLNYQFVLECVKQYLCKCNGKWIWATLRYNTCSGTLSYL
jgi:hypothetical protein